MENQDQQPVAPVEKNEQKSSKKRLIWGIVLLVVPIVCLIVILGAYASLSFSATKLAEEAAESAQSSKLKDQPVTDLGNGLSVVGEPSADSETGLTEASSLLIKFMVARVVLSILGLICVIGIIVGIPLGIYLLVTAKKKK